MDHINGPLSILFTGLVCAELIVRWFFDREGVDWKDSAANIVIGCTDKFLTLTIWLMLMYAGWSVCYALTPLRIEMSNWWAWPLAILLTDLSYYVYHRVSHHLRPLWSIHSVHHSSQDYNFTTAIRLSWFSNAYRWLFWVPLPLMGYSPEMTTIVFMLVRLYQAPVHSTWIPSPPVYSWVFVTPSFHRVHHGRNEKYLNKNFGGITVIWDKLFGTYQAEDEPVRYGIPNPVNTYNPFRIVLGDLWEWMKRKRASELQNRPAEQVAERLQSAENETLTIHEG
ncbi:MAG: sterol desaturase family protein [Planctomycetaceae bacterium]|nr:sterol desaturase family protein [Planctomycetaceae bacterium]